MLLYIFCACVLLAVSFFATFRVAESNWRKTFWADMVGFVLVAIGGFWSAILYAKLAWAPLYYSPYEEEATAVLFTGIALVLWSVTCHRLRRRATDPRRAQQAEGEESYGGTE